LSVEYLMSIAVTEHQTNRSKEDVGCSNKRLDFARSDEYLQDAADELDKTLQDADMIQDTGDSREIAQQGHYL